VGEAVCVAGVRIDHETPEWIRLFPVGFRELPDSAKFRKWQVIELEGSKSRGDLRPESYTPHLHTVVPGEVIDAKHKWRQRREMLGNLIGSTTLCELMAAQEGGAHAPSLGLVKVAPGAVAQVIEGPVWEPERQLLAELAAAPHLLREKALSPLKPPMFQIRYQWHCLSSDCPGHQHSSCDWEVGAAALNWSKSYSDVRIPLLEKFGEGMLGSKRDTYFFVGNQHQRPRTFMVLGTFYPAV
jgi:hypothetical protein